MCNSHHFPISSLLAISLLVQCTCSRFASQPNVLLIVSDDLRPSLGGYGYNIAQTPHINKLLNQSTVFLNAHAQQALCGPSRTSFLIGRRPDSIGVFDQHGPYWRKKFNFTTLPEYFKQNGYHTASLGKIFHPGAISGKTDDYPHSWSEKPYHPSTEKYKNSKVCLDPDGSLHANIVCPVNVSAQPEQTLPDIQTTEKSIKKLEELSAHSQPFFLAIGYHKPHIPLKYPMEYDNLYPLDKMKLAVDPHKPVNLPSVAWNPFMDIKSRDDIASLNITFPYGEIPSGYQRNIIRSYLASVSYIDDLIGQLLEVKDHLRLANNTIVVFMSDHGWSLGEHGEWCKYSNYDIATRVPFSIYIPESFQQAQVRSKVYDMVELVDLFPTLVDIAGLDQISQCYNFTQSTCTDGKSLTSAIYGKTNPSISVAFTQYPRPSLEPQDDSDQPKTKDIKYMGYAVKTLQYRYVRWVSFNSSTLRSNLTDVYAEELYDIYADPLEDKNVITYKAGVASSLYKILQKLL